MYSKWLVSSSEGEDFSTRRRPYNSLSFLILVSILCHRFVISADGLAPRGVPLSRASLYDPQKDFSCLDGSKLIPFSLVNDDYCDCSDGSDEPGTSACSRGSFYCLNPGHVSGYIPSNRVNDNICDCCDGSDESESRGCPNTCDELGRAAREEAERQATLAKEGFQKRLELSNNGKEYRKTKGEEKAKLEAERQRLEAIKEDKQRLKEEVEKPEKEALERHRMIEDEKRKKEQEEEDAKSGNEAEDMFNMLDSNDDGKITKDELKVRQTFDKNKDGEVTDEEAMFFLNMEEEMSKEEFVKSGWMLAKPFFLMEQGMFKPPVGHKDDVEEEDLSTVSGGRPVTEEPPLREYQDDEIEDILGSEKTEDTGIPGVDPAVKEDDEEQEEEEEEGAETTSDEVPAAEEPVHVAQKYDDETQALINEADKARNDFNEADRNVRDVVQQLEELNEILNLDFGEDDRYAPLLGQCFDYEDREYVYTLCPFKTANQKGRNGGGEVSLGKWGSWNGPEDNKYSSMIYDRGQNCWNGPNRSAKVNIVCGVDNRLIGVSEPSRCEYHYEFTSPAACSKPDLSLNHDEL